MSAKRRNLPKVRNPMARALTDRLFRSRVKPSGKGYRRSRRAPDADAG